jgi:hypothetical protein
MMWAAGYLAIGLWLAIECLGYERSGAYKMRHEPWVVYTVVVVAWLPCVLNVLLEKITGRKQ